MRPLRLAAIFMRPLRLAAIVGVIGLVAVVLIVAIWWRTKRK